MTYWLTNQWTIRPSIHHIVVIWGFLLLPTHPRHMLPCKRPISLVVFPAPQSTSFQTSSASACLISCRFLCFLFIFSLWLRYLTAVRAAHGWHDYCVNPPQYVIYRPLCLIRECPAVALLEFYFHFFIVFFFGNVNWVQPIDRNRLTTRCRASLNSGSNFLGC